MTTATSPARPATTTVDLLLDALAAGRAPDADLFAPDAVLDATVPHWRFRLRGRDRVRGQLAGWFADPGTYDELRRHPTASGEVVEYCLSWQENGVPFAAHHVHVLDLDADGRITLDRFWCGGRWHAGLLAEMEDAQRRLDGSGAR